MKQKWNYLANPNLNCVCSQQKAKCRVWISRGLQSSVLFKVQESPQLKVSTHRSHRLPLPPHFSLSTRPLCVFFSTIKDDVLSYCRQVQEVAQSMKPKETPALKVITVARLKSEADLSVFMFFFSVQRGGGKDLNSARSAVLNMALCCKWVFCACFSNRPCWHISVLPHKCRPDWDQESSSAFQASWQTSGLRCSELDLNYNH